ncbi:MAG: four helix bundle protein [Nitrospira sp.]|nr:four helix bundle protein [Nitrospira sp.]
MGLIKSFEDLEVWQVGRTLRKRLYALASHLPEHERYNLAGQIRSAAISLTANLAEGYGRFHFKENAQFCRIARGSACELLDHLITCRDEGYVEKEEYQELRRELFTFLRLINGYIRSIGKAGGSEKSQ